MKILFLGGSGIISTAASHLALARQFDLFLLNRGKRPVPAGARQLVADLADPSAVRAALSDHTWDAVVQWIAFTPEDVARDLKLFRGRTRQYVLISSASVYQKPMGYPVITESTPLANPFWEYSRKKIACEEVLQKAIQAGFPGVIVRPSLTYGNDQVPLVLNSWTQPWTAIDRLRRGLPMVVPGDGTSLWTVTHNSDFAQGLVGLLGHPQANGHAFHITSDEHLTWDQIFRLTAEAAGAPEPKLVHIASDFISACVPSWRGPLLGDKSVSVLFDNSKIKRFVPGFVARTNFRSGIRQTLDYLNADPTRQSVDPKIDATLDKLIAVYERGLTQAQKDFSS